MPVPMRWGCGRSRPEGASALAFNAIAQDPRVLQRAARPQAIRMAAQAEDFAPVAAALAADSDTWRAVTLFVQRIDR